MLKKVLLGIILCFNISYSYINIYPTNFVKDITNGAQENFKLYNRTQKPIRYRVYLEQLEDSTKDMYDWIEVYPKSISLNPLEEKEIRVLVTPKKGVKKGEYKGRLIVKEVGVPGYTSGKSVDFMTMLILNMTGYINE
ncbi:MAG: hypothetical protein ACRC51_08830 [Cetobacterium sp.]